MEALLKNTALMVSSVLVLFASISISASTFCFWYEPDCPEELLE